GRPGAVAPRAGARARRRLVPRALHAALRRPGRRARVPIALSEQPADVTAGAPVGRAAARYGPRAGRVRGGVRTRAGGILGSAVRGDEPRNTVEDAVRDARLLTEIA